MLLGKKVNVELLLYSFVVCHYEQPKQITNENEKNSNCNLTWRICSVNIDTVIFYT